MTLSDLLLESTEELRDAAADLGLVKLWPAASLLNLQSAEGSRSISRRDGAGAFCASVIPSLDDEVAGP